VTRTDRIWPYPDPAHLRPPASPACFARLLRPPASPVCASACFSRLLLPPHDQRFLAAAADLLRRGGTARILLTHPGSVAAAQLEVSEDSPLGGFVTGRFEEFWT
jgi:hypothetical protein